MIGYLVGTVAERFENIILLEVNGIGYEIFMCGKIDVAEVKIYIYENIKEDAYDLYGFVSLAEKELFKKLISVNGIGPKAAAALIVLHGINLVECIVNEDASEITRVPGIGAKIASRLILELKDKLSAFKTLEKRVVVDGLEEATAALVALGYNKKQAARAVNAVYNYSDSIEDTIKKALAVLI